MTFPSNVYFPQDVLFLSFHFRDSLGNLDLAVGFNYDFKYKCDYKDKIFWASKLGSLTSFCIFTGLGFFHLEIQGPRSHPRFLPPPAPGWPLPIQSLNYVRSHDCAFLPLPQPWPRSLRSLPLTWSVQHLPYCQPSIQPTYCLHGSQSHLFQCQCDLAACIF